VNQPPRDPGSYALLMALDAPAVIRAGRLGEFALPAGSYVYCGSAFGPGGLRARLERHARASGALHWHIDYLRRAARLVDWAWVANERAECRWAQALVTLGGQVIAPHFGSSDCHNRCPSHLLYFPAEVDLMPMLEKA